MKACGKYVIVEVIQQRQTEGGIILPEARVETPCRGKVVSIGDKVELELRVDDTVYFEKSQVFDLGDNLVAIESYLILARA